MKRLFCALLFAVMLVMTSTATVTNTATRVGPYTVTSLPVVLPVTFSFQQASDLLVLNLGTAGTEYDPPTVLTLNSDYTVTGGGYNASTQMQTGSVTVVGTGANTVKATDLIVILRAAPNSQASSLVSGQLTAAAIERAIDKQATLSQQVAETASRGLRFEAGETIDGTLVRSSRSGKYLAFDSDGNIEYLDGSGGGGGGATYTAGTGLVLASNEFSVNPTQSITSLTVTNPITGSLAGNAATATALATARTINGVNFDGSANVTVPAAAGTLTGATLASGVTASSLTSVGAGTIGTMAIQNANLVSITGGSIDGASVTGLAAPAAGTDAANKDYVDSISAGIVPRTGVVAATTANITLSAPQTIDGVAVIAGNRVLVKAQTLPEENGIYDVAAGAWTRSSDSNTAAELLFGYYYFTSAGTINGATSWFIQTAPTSLGVDPVAFAQFSASASYTAGTGLGLIGSQFSLTSPVTAALGGTGQAGGYTAGDILYATSSTSLSRLGIGAAGTVLTPNGSAIQWNPSPTLTSLQATNIGNVTPGAGSFTTVTATTPIAVTQGGTGRASSTTAYGLLAAGTTATGAQQTLAAGATTELLVGGGASALPVWTTATGSGAPVRGTSPTLVTPALGTPSSGVVTNLTGTASIDINGTVGGTTPAAGGFTTLAASSTVSGAGFSTYLASPPAIGGTTPSTGAFTTLSASGLAYSDGGGVARTVTDSLNVFSGGTHQDGGNFVGYGSTHATDPDTFRLRIGTTSVVVGSSTGLAVTGTLSATGAVTGSNLSGTNTGDQTSVSGNAGTATALATIRTIGGSNFDGTANVTSFPVPGAIGGTTPSTGAFTTITINTDANLRTTKGSFNQAVNVMDYGATGDGVTNDTAAIAAAVAALPAANAYLEFPAGTYITDEFTITGKTGLTVIGQGYGNTTIKGRTGNRILIVNTSTNITVRGLSFNGNCSARTAGQQAVSIDGSGILFTENRIINSGEYACMFGGNALTSDVQVTENYIGSNYADGVNFQYVTKGVIANNIIDGVDDDGIAVGYNGSGNASQIVVSNNFIRARADLGTTWGRGIFIANCTDVIVEGNVVDTIKQTGILLIQESAGQRPTRIMVKNNKVRNVASSSGHGIVAYGTSYCTLEGNDVTDQATGNNIEIADWQYLSIKGGTLTQSLDLFARGIHADEASGWGSTTWNNLDISNVTIRMVGASTNSCVYLSPNAANTMDTLTIVGIVSSQVVAGDYIAVASARTATLGKIVNNTTMVSGRTVSPATGGVFTTVNNQ